MRIKKKNVVLSVLATLCFASCLQAAVALNERGSAIAESAQIVTENAIAASYELNSEFFAPTVELEYEGKKVPSEAVLIEFPQGKIYDGSQGLKLEEYGEYTVTYYATVEGVRVQAEATFKVGNYLFSATTSASKIEYEEALYMNASKSGLHVTLSDGDVFSYNQIIDLGTEDATVDLVNVYPYSLTNLNGEDGTRMEAQNLVVTLTDCYDSSNYIEYIVYYRPRTGKTPYPYFFAGASNQKKYGLMTPKDNATNVSRVQIDGKWYMYYNNGYTNGLTTYGTTPSKAATDNVGWKFSYNPAAKNMYIGGVLVNSLSNVDIYEDDKLFQGFTTGEVYLSVRGMEYYGAELNFDIDLLGGRENEDLQNAALTDSIAPKITVEGVKEEGQELNVALGESFTIFPATAQDVNLVGGVKASVYYDYGTSGETSVAIIDGAFVPNRTGKYAIVYTAKDSEGLVGKRVVYLRCVRTKSGKSIDLETQQISELIAGQENELPSYEAVGLNGEVQVKITAACGQETVLVDANTRTFVPLELGEYTIKYEYGDEYYSYSYEYKVSSVANGDVAVDGKFVLPEFYVKGISYDVEKIPMYEFVNGVKKEVNGELYLYADGEAEGQKIAFDEFTIQANESVRFELKYNGVSYLVSETIPVIDAGVNGNLDLTKYFVGDYTVKSPGASSSLLCESNVYSGNNLLKFVNPISLQNFSLKFSVAKAWANFDVLKIYLVDYYDRENVITLELFNEITSYQISVNGGARYRVNSDFVSKIFTVKYADCQFTVSNNVLTKEIKQTKSFSSDKILLHFELMGIKEAEKIGFEIREIANQPFSATIKRDMNTALLAFQSSAKSYGRGEVATVYPAQATDVLGNVLAKNIKVQVYKPNDEYAVSVDGVVLDGTQDNTRAYDVLLDTFGAYTVYYNVVDSFKNGEGNPEYYVMLVEDSVPPTLTLEDGYAETSIVTVKLNSTVKLVGYTASDDVTSGEALKVFYAVETPNKCLHILFGDSFKASIVGEWKVFYYCYDEAGNFATRSYTVVVE